jgi:hypothetical protein
MEFQNEYGDLIYVSKRIYDGVTKKVEIISIRPVGRDLIIHYKSKKGGNRGILELYDIGPAPIKRRNDQ